MRKTTKYKSDLRISLFKKHKTTKCGNRFAGLIIKSTRNITTRAGRYKYSNLYPTLCTFRNAYGLMIIVAYNCESLEEVYCVTHQRNAIFIGSSPKKYISFQN